MGVPAELVTASDFVMVRLGLMRHLRNPLAAVVFARIHYRTGPDSRVSFEHDGRRWWTATITEIADEMGASEGQIRRVLDDLERQGALVRERLCENGPYDRRWSYSPVIAEESSAALRTGASDASQAPSAALVLSVKDLEDAARAKHPREEFAVRSLTRIRQERRLPFTVDDLLKFAYQLGEGDPWVGYQIVSAHTEAAVTGAWDKAKALRARMGVA